MCLCVACRSEPGMKNFSEYESTSDTQDQSPGPAGRAAHGSRPAGIGTSMRSSLHSGLLRTVVFVKLPVFGFHATCRLFTMITRLQFPQRCDYSPERMMVHELHNTGWSATFNALLFKVANILSKREYPNKMIVVPTAMDFRGQQRKFLDRDGSVVESSKGWYWTDADLCPNDIQAYDPWACNFISLSNCSSIDTGISLRNTSRYPPKSRDYPFETPETIDCRGFDLDNKNGPTLMELREKYDDAPLHSKEQWVSE